MNVEKLKKLQAEVRIGGKGTARRKKKIVHNNAATDDRKLQTSLKKISAKTIHGIDEITMFKDDGSSIHFNCPKLEASLNSNTYIVTGHGEKKFITKTMPPDILTQVELDSMTQFKVFASELATKSAAAAGMLDDDDDDDDDDDEVADMVKNFEEVALGPTEKVRFA